MGETADGDAAREAREAKGVAVAAEVARASQMDVVTAAKSVMMYSGGLRPLPGPALVQDLAQARHLLLLLHLLRHHHLHLHLPLPHRLRRIPFLGLLAVVEKAAQAALVAAALGSTARHPRAGRERVIFVVGYMQ